MTPAKPQSRRRRDPHPRDPAAACAACASESGTVLVHGRLLCAACAGDGPVMTMPDGRGYRPLGLDTLIERFRAENDERAELRRRAGDYRPTDRLGRREPRNMFADPVVLFRAAPGLAAAFDKPVPDTHLQTDKDGTTVLTCPCGTATTIPPASVCECEGNCGRYFITTSTGVRCAHPPADEEVLCPPSSA